jgi:hypothetical protein
VRIWGGACPEPEAAWLVTLPHHDRPSTPPPSIPHDHTRGVGTVRIRRGARAVYVRAPVGKRFHQHLVHHVPDHALDEAHACFASCQNRPALAHTRTHPQSRFTPPYGAGEALGMGARPHRMGQGSPLYGGTKLGGPQKNFSRWAPLGPSNSRPPLGPPFALTRLTRGLGARGIGRR